MALDDNGIAPVDMENLDEVALSDPEPPMSPWRAGEESSVASTPSDQGAGSESEIFGTPASSAASPPLRRHPVDASSRNGYFYPSTPQPIFGGPSPSSPLHSGGQARSMPVQTSDVQYAALLTKVISVARRASLPTRRQLDANGSEATSSRASNTEDWGLRSGSQIERDCKVGAAGELYVSILRACSLHSAL